MKKIFTLALILALTLSLSACGEKQVTDEPLSITLAEDGKTILYEGTFTGTLVKKVPEGQGTFKSSEGWTYEGNFTEGAIAGAGSFENKAMSVMASPGGNLTEGVFSGSVVDGVPQGEGAFESNRGWTYTGNFTDAAIAGSGTMEDVHLESLLNGVMYSYNYTGPVTDGMPDGEGVIECDEGWTYRGPFMQGTFDMRGTIENFNYSVEVDGVSFPGIYDGEILDMVPEGKGSFKTAEDSPAQWSYEGGFTEGKLSGEGTAEALPIDLLILDLSVPTYYTGQLKDGKAEGQGVADSASANDQFVFEGSFLDSKANGIGDLYLHIDDYDKEGRGRHMLTGNLTGGSWDPSIADQYQTMGFFSRFWDLDTSAAEAFLDNNPQLFLAAEPAADNTLQPYDFQAFRSEAGAYSDRLTSIEGMVLTEGAQDIYGKTLDYLYIMGKDGNMNVIFFPEAHGYQAYDDAVVQALPVGPAVAVGNDGTTVDVVVYYGSWANQTIVE